MRLGPPAMNDLAEAEKEIHEAKKALFEAYRNRPAEAVEDYVLSRLDGSAVRLSELFGDHDDLILIHNMGHACDYCTMWADGFDGLVSYIETRAAFVVCSPDPPETQRRMVEERDWSFTMVSADGSSFIDDMGFASEDAYHPGVSSFYRGEDGTIRRIASRGFGPYDDYCSTWNFFGILRDGVDGWQPGAVNSP